MLDERSISARCLVTTALWALSFTAWTVSWLLDADDLGRLSLIICGAAVTATIKGMFIQQHRKVKEMLAVTALVEREFVRPIR